MVIVRVPATTANLGPGFDCLGAALSLYARFSFEKREAGLEITGCKPAYANSENLVYKAFCLALKENGLQPEGVRIHLDSDIPVSRGLGSSAACAAGGILGASALYGLDLSREAVFRLAAELEGHPDNVAPAIYGGLRVSLTQDGVPHSLPSPVHPSLRFLALIPDFPLETKKARAVLPQTVSLQDAVYNLSRTAFLLKALETGEAEQIRLGMGDRLHQDARLPLIENGYDLKARLEQEGAIAVFISGAGPSLMCLYQDPGFPAKAEQIIKTAFPRFSVLPLDLCAQGAVIERMN
ncbi:MAG: homoserine kinase [Bacillota bacterium]|nr:homoserine kinase [Bacillota bacterium]